MAFFEWPNIELPARKDTGIPATGRQFDHVSFNVESEQALLELQTRVRAAGVPATDVIDHQIMHSIYFDDPNGISLEFSVWMKDIEKEPSLRDPNPVAAMAERVG